VTNGSARGDACTVWRVCVCLVLIASILYNPFLSLKIQSDGPIYASLARHRSTVGSSVEETATKISVVQGAQTEYAARIILDQALPPQPELIASICFRPPPSL
jgi:hypothetical protein